MSAHLKTLTFLTFRLSFSFFLSVFSPFFSLSSRKSLLLIRIIYEEMGSEGERIATIIPRTLLFLHVLRTGARWRGWKFFFSASTFPNLNPRHGAENWKKCEWEEDREGEREKNRGRERKKAWKNREERKKWDPSESLSERERARANETHTKIREMNDQIATISKKNYSVMCLP